MSEEQVGAAPAAAEGNAAPAASTPEVSITDTMSAVFDKLNPQEGVNRAETGQFESKNPVEAETSPEQVSEGQTQTEVTSEPAQPAIAAPQSLPAELREEWGKVPPKFAEWVGKREAESHKRITELGEAAKASEQIRSVIDRYQQTFKGVPVDQGLEKLLAANAFLERSPLDGIKWLADAYGVDLSSLGAKTADGQQENGEVRALKSEIAELKRVIADTSNRVQSREQREAEERSQSLAKVVEDFAKDKADHWSDIESDVLEQIAAINARPHDLTPEKVLEKAYQRAVKINESVANKLTEAKRKAEAEKAEAEKKRKADEAKKLASLNVKSNSGASPKPSGNWESTMREVANRLMS